MILNSSELGTSYDLSTYKKMNYELKNIHWVNAFQKFCKLFQLITSVRTICTISRNLYEPIGTNRNQFSIWIKIHSRTYTPIFDSNKNPFHPIFIFILIHMHNFWFEWKSELNQTIFDSNENENGIKWILIRI